ncbi:Lactonase, 7-bladed beta-propeller-domain-containing protein [Lasiosphaeria miniovina]|uniref:Lactonase, 7-bladed beta-propeller-domain-containing protein n=1 Tax=Lasiosphaeria miniovina TaxID=1954250 RepID=A0AA40A703_9PEZI|nr:Lactonase, 7-bladed beta-propeller-domain-containing protein [Lasiosphaeria miniovina]KAK0710323.1 Lactonase, 7-bladed beta-propeller-domain-containing protein [Lasiosphaeria miniovina]
MLQLGKSLLAGIGLVPSVLGATLIASHFSGPVYTLSLTVTDSSGKLTQTSQATGCGNTPAWLELYSDTRKLYCFDENWNGAGVITEYSVASDGRLTSSGQVKTSGNTVHGSLYGGSDGRGFIASAQYSPSTITTYKMPLSSSKVLEQTKFALAARGPNSRQDVSHPHETRTDPTGKFMLVPDLGADVVRIFKIDATSGKLTTCPAGQASPGDGPRHIVFWKSAAGVQKAYTVNELGNSVSSWDVSYPSDPSGCLGLARTQTLSTYAPGKKGGSTTKAAEVRVVGNFLYATNRADQTFGSQQDSIATYTIDATSGAIAWLEAANSYTYYPRTFQFNNDGTLVAVGGQTSSSVAIVARDTTTGRLGKLVASIQIGPKGRAGEEDGLSAVVWVE